MFKIFRLINKCFDAFMILIKSGSDFARYKGVQVGLNCRIIIKEFGTEPWLISIGNNVTITHGVKLLTHDGSTWLIRDSDGGRRFLYRRIVIGDYVFIGVNSIIMPGCKIGNNVIIAAGSVITKSVPDGVIVGGNPGKIIGSFDQYRTKVLQDYISERDMNLELSYKERISKVVDDSFKSNLSR